MIQNIRKNSQCTDMESPKRDVSLMSQTTQIKLEPKYCVFLVSSLGYIQFTPQLFSTMSSPTRLGILEQPTFTSANRHQKNTKSTTQKVSGLYFVDSFKDRFGDDDGGYGLTPMYTMSISLCSDALC